MTIKAFDKFYLIDDDELWLFVRLSPKAAKDSINGLYQHTDGKTYLNIHIRALPEKNQANKALIKFLGKMLKIAPSRLTISKGHLTRFKQIVITEMPPDITEKLNNLTRA